MTIADWLLAALVAVICGLDRVALSQFMISRPLVAGPLTGALLGEPLLGLQVGMLLLTLPVWLTVNYLGSPDNGVILAAYLGSWLMAGGFLAIGSCMSALTRNQVVAFILAVVVCFLFLLSGLPMVMNLFTGWAPQVLLDGIASLSFLKHFADISKGVIDLRDLVYFVLMTGFWLVASLFLNHISDLIEQDVNQDDLLFYRNLEDPNERGHDAIRRVFLLEIARVLAPRSGGP